MKFSFNWIQELAGTTLSAQESAALFTAKAFEVQSLTPVGDDTVFDIDVLSNRPDALSHVGVARELCALTNQRWAAPMYEYSVAERPAVSVTIVDPQACPRYSGLVVRGVKVGPSPAWLKQRIEACGLASINNVVDVTNYVMLELGQPMHAFDLRLVDRVVVRPAHEGEKLTALDEARTEYALTPDMLVIADSEKPLAIAGIKGGANSGISDDTTDILLEAAHFDPVSIRATSRALGLRTDASIRFAVGVDPSVTAPALIRAAQLLAKVAGGTADGGIIDAYPREVASAQVVLDPAYVRSLLGVAVGDAQIRSTLESLGFETEELKDMIRVTVPTRRMDVTTAEDLIEEIGRVYGYDAIPSIPPTLPIYDARAWVEEDVDVAWDEYAYSKERGSMLRLLAGMGYTEVYNYVFLSDELVHMLKLEGLAELAMPQSSEYRWLRRSLIPRLLLNARDNLRFFDEVRLMEHGHVYDHIAQGKESARLGLALARKGADAQLFYELKGAVELLLQRMGMSGCSFDDADPMTWDAGAVQATLAGHRALIRLSDGTPVGFLGVVHPRIAEACKLKGASAAIAELDARLLVASAQHEREFEPLPKFPAIVRDVALLVPETVKIDAILQEIQRADAAGLVRDVDVFDIFQPTGKEIAGDGVQDKKSVAFHIVFRSDERTLKDAEVADALAVITTALQKSLGAQTR